MRHTWLALLPSLIFTIACGGDDAPTFTAGAGGSGGSAGSSAKGGSSAGGSSVGGTSAGGSSAGGSSAGGSGSSAGGSSAGGTDSGGGSSGGSAGEAGETSTGGTSGCVDVDEDGACAADDCDDDDDQVHPGATEIPCNGKNDDCDSDTPDGVDLDSDGACSTDDCDDSPETGASCSEGCVTALDDMDGDHFGDPATARVVCTLPADTVEDLDGMVDCDDDDDTLTPLDLDGDGVSSCDGDCNDADPSVAPGLPDACPIGVNNDCDDAMDEDAADSDGDGITDCADGCPTVPLTPTSITWRWQSAAYGNNACSCTGSTFDSSGWEFFVNGVSQGTGSQTDLPICTCETEPGEVTLDFAGTWNPAGDDNVLAFTKETNDVGEIIGWVQAEIDYDGKGSETICVTGTCPGTPGYYYAGCSLDCGPIGDVCFTECDPALMTLNHSGDLDADGTPSACDCSDDPSIDSDAAARSPRNAELCDDGIDNDCDSFIDANDDIANSTNDSECESCERTSATEVSCDDEIDDDCDGLTDQDDPDCMGSVCSHPTELNGLALGSARESQSGVLDLCASGADTSSTDVCDTTVEQVDHWQELTVYDPAGTGYRLQICFDNAPGEIILSTDLSCGDDPPLACVGAFDTSSENCATYPAAEEDPFFGTASYQLIYRSDEGGCPEYDWLVTVVEP